MTRRGTTGIAWLIGLIAVVVSTLGQPVATRMLGSHQAEAEQVGSADLTVQQSSIPVLEPRDEHEPRG